MTHVLSILDPGTPDPESFALFDGHHRTVLRFHDIVQPMAAMVLPERKDVEDILAFGHEVVEDTVAEEAGHLLIHCHMGISRSTAAMVMMMACARPHESDDELVARVTALRPQAWPNLRMIDFADDILGRSGGLSAAVSRLHARQIADKPHLAEVFRRLGRSLRGRARHGTAGGLRC